MPTFSYGVRVLDTRTPERYGTVRDTTTDGAVWVEWDGEDQWRPHPPSSLLRAECTCVFDCADDPATACCLSGDDWHIHPASQGAGFGPCPLHPDAPGDW